MDLELISPAAALASPAIRLQDFHPELAVTLEVEPKPTSFSKVTTHAGRLISHKNRCCSDAGRNPKNRRNDIRTTSGPVIQERIPESDLGGIWATTSSPSCRFRQSDSTAGKRKVSPFQSRRGRRPAAVWRIASHIDGNTDVPGRCATRATVAVLLVLNGWVRKLLSGTPAVTSDIFPARQTCSSMRGIGWEERHARVQYRFTPGVP